jgi:hypothetical protein
MVEDQTISKDPERGSKLRTENRLRLTEAALLWYPLAAECALRRSRLWIGVFVGCVYWLLVDRRFIRASYV